MQDNPLVPSQPMEQPPDSFAGSLILRQINRKELLTWVKDNLTEGVDYGVIPGTEKKTRDEDGNEVKVGQKVLWQPGSQKICGLLGLRATFPDAHRWVEVALTGAKIEMVLMRCHLIDGNGALVGEGMGARSAIKVLGVWEGSGSNRRRTGERQEYDLNYAVKMAQKSAQIDAVLRAGGLSSIFTQPFGEDDEGNNDETPLSDHPPELQFLEMKAEELFGDQAKTMLEALALKRMRIPDGDYSKIKRKHLDYCVRVLRERAEQAGKD